MRNLQLRNPERLGWGVAAVAGVALVAHTAIYDFVSDDAFITLRYARNLITGHGLVFNPGERVEGITSLLWTLVTAGGGLLGADLLGTSRVLGVVAALATLLLTQRLAQQVIAPEARLARVLPPLVLALDGAFACWAASGMETALFTCLVVASVVATLEGRAGWSAVATGASILTRPEGLMLAVLLGLYLVIRRDGAESRRRWLGWALVCGGVALALHLGRYAYYGDWLPNTFYAKTGASWEQVSRGLVYFLAYCRDHESLVVVGAATLLGLASRAWPARLVAAAAMAFWAATIAVGGDGLPMYRFAIPALPFLLVVEALLLAELGRRVLRPGLPPRVAQGVVCGVAVVWGVVHATPPRLEVQYELYWEQKNLEVPRWTQVGKWFHQNAGPGESIATVPIGAVGYYSGLVVRDILGLTDRHIARRAMPMGSGVAGHEKHDGQYVLGRRPTYLLLGNIDVTERPRNPRRWPFIPYTNSAIWAREADFYDTDWIFRAYRPRSVPLAAGSYLNFYELKPEFREGEGPAAGPGGPARLQPPPVPGPR